MDSALRRRSIALAIARPEALFLAVLAVVSVFLANEFAAAAESATVVVDADFPGGNIVLDAIDGHTIRLRHDQRDTVEPWFYWYFRVRGAAGQRLTFQFTQGPVIGLRGPAVSVDGGQTWQWLGAGGRDDEFAFAFGPEHDDVRFGFCVPYLESHLREFLNRHVENPSLVSDELCRTAAGRTVERLRFGRLDGGATLRVLLTARHHACEAPAGYLLEGIIEAALADDETGRWLREHVEFLAVPFVDKDGVENGDQGKLRRPHDPWLDYHGASIYPAVAALRQQIPAWSDGRLTLAIDLHAPSRREEKIYFAGPRGEEAVAEFDGFCRLLLSNLRGPLPFDPTDNLPFGRGWNVPATYGQRQSFAIWAEELPGVRLATTLELPYAQVRGREVTPETARRFGADLTAAIAAYLRTVP